jgi:hypothetical protein
VVVAAVLAFVEHTPSPSSSGFVSTWQAALFEADDDKVVMCFFLILLSDSLYD